MAGKFTWKLFEEVNLDDAFFDSLKSDYPEFIVWYQKKIQQRNHTLVFEDEQGVGAFLYLKDETEKITIQTSELPLKKRIKIGTLRIADRLQGQRIGEGALGFSLWFWQKNTAEEIYVTVFERHSLLIKLFEKFGFNRIGYNERGECLYLRTKASVDFTDAFTSFPFIDGRIIKANLLPIDDTYHDKLFPYSELYGEKLEVESIVAGNGISKIFIGFPSSVPSYEKNCPLLVYRKFNGDGQKTYKSVITSFCTVTSIAIVKTNGKHHLSFHDFLSLTANKTVFTKDELEVFYKNRYNVIVIEMVYNGYFGKGNNVTHFDLNSAGLFNGHPYSVSYTKEEFIKILNMGKINVQNIIIN